MRPCCISTPPPASASPSLAALRRGWAQLIRRVYKIDPLACPRCQGRDAGGRLHYRGPRHPPHPRAPWRLGSPRYPRPRSTSRNCRGSRFHLIRLTHPEPAPAPRRRRQGEASLGHDPTRRDPPDGARMTPADRTAAIREPAAGGRRRPTALPRPLGSLAPLRAQIKVPILIWNDDRSCLRDRQYRCRRLRRARR